MATSRRSSKGSVHFDPEDLAAVQDRFGEIVWAKQRNFPIWPGCIYDPRFCKRETQVQACARLADSYLIWYYGPDLCFGIVPYGQVISFAAGKAAIAERKHQPVSAKLRQAIDEAQVEFDRPKDELLAYMRGMMSASAFSESMDIDNEVRDDQELLAAVQHLGQPAVREAAATAAAEDGPAQLELHFPLQVEPRAVTQRAPTAPAPVSGLVGYWQDDSADLPLRRAVLARIQAWLQSYSAVVRRPVSSKLQELAVQLEESLFRSSDTRMQYADARTLHARVHSLAKQFCAARQAYLARKKKVPNSSGGGSSSRRAPQPASGKRKSSSSSSASDAAAAARSEKDGEDSPIQWRTTGSRHIGRAVHRTFWDSYTAVGRVTHWVPAYLNAGLALWHVKHADGDEEDLFEAELLEAIAAAEEADTAAAAAAELQSSECDGDAADDALEDVKDSSSAAAAAAAADASKSSEKRELINKANSKMSSSSAAAAAADVAKSSEKRELINKANSKMSSSSSSSSSAAKEPQQKRSKRAGRGFAASSPGKRQLELEPDEGNGASDWVPLIGPANPPQTIQRSSTEATSHIAPKEASAAAAAAQKMESAKASATAAPGRTEAKSSSSIRSGTSRNEATISQSSNAAAPAVINVTVMQQQMVCPPGESAAPAAAPAAAAPAAAAAAAAAPAAAAAAVGARTQSDFEKMVAEQETLLQLMKVITESKVAASTKARWMQQLMKK